MSREAVRTGREAGQLSELARRHGVQLYYTGADGSPHWSGPDAVVAVLAAMGVPITRADEAAEVLAGERRAPAPALEPVIAQWSDSPEPVTVGLPNRSDPGSAWLTLTLEDGQVLRQRVGTGEPAPRLESPPGNRDHYRVRMMPESGTVPPGYHRLRLEAAGIAASSMMVVAPRCPAPRRCWGGSIPLHAVRAAGDWGVGSYVGLARLVEWLGGRGGAWVGLLPLFPTFLDTATVDPSPYLPVTKLGWNEIHVDPTQLPELAATPSALRLLESSGVQSRLQEFRSRSQVDHAAVMSTLRSILEPMAETLFSGSSARRIEFDAFLAERPYLEPYARFRATAAGVNADDARFPGLVEYHLYAQWAAETQLAAAASAGRPGAGLYLDLPVGVHPSGFDPKWEPEAFVPGIHGGAPPDRFQPDGQDWAFPPLNPRGLRGQEYRYLIASLRHAMRHADAVRLDHVMSLHRLYWIPEGADATDGVYVNYPDAEMRAVVSLEASRWDTAVVGEDLGTVPAPVRADMRRDGMLRSWVLQFESTANDPLPPPPRQALASWGTHDLATFAAYWDGLDIDAREERGDIGRREAEAEKRTRREWRRALCQRLSVPTDHPRDVLAGCLNHLASSPATVVLIDLEDLWLERVPQNRPGTGTGHGNWERRSALSLDEMFADPQVKAVLAGVDQRRCEPEPSGRGDRGRRARIRRAG